MKRVILLVIGLCLVFALAYYSIQAGWKILREKPPRPTSQEIKMTIENNILHFNKITFWNENDFAKLSKSKYEFSSSEVNSFKSNLKDHEGYIANLRLEFDDSRLATVLSCDVQGIEVGGKYDFDWFLKPLSLTLPRVDLDEIEKIP